MEKIKSRHNVLETRSQRLNWTMMVMRGGLGGGWEGGEERGVFKAMVMVMMAAAGTSKGKTARA